MVSLIWGCESRCPRRSTYRFLYIRFVNITNEEKICSLNPRSLLFYVVLLMSIGVYARIQCLLLLRTSDAIIKLVSSSRSALMISGDVVLPGVTNSYGSRAV
jgi:hypothetical protein